MAQVRACDDKCLAFGITKQILQHRNELIERDASPIIGNHWDERTRHQCRNDWDPA